jgi:hypothetical protein
MPHDPEQLRAFAGDMQVLMDDLVVKDGQLQHGVAEAG